MKKKKGTRCIIQCLLLASALVSGCTVGVNREITREEQEIARQIEEVMTHDLCSHGTAESCEYDEVTFAGDTSPSSDDDVIMIIDAQLKVPTLALHGSRVLAHFKATEGPKYYVPFTPSARFPKGAHKILHQIFKGKQSLASSKALLSLGTTFGKKYVKLLEDGDRMGHGSTSFNILAELNPQAKFVVVHTDSAKVPLCWLNQAGGEAALHQYWEARAEALSKIALAYHVKWVNYSMGYDLKAVQSLWTEMECRGTYPTEEAMQRLIGESNAIARKLSAISNLLFVQAAPYPETYLTWQHQQDFCADCERLPQRLRVGYLNLEADTINAEESRKLALLPTSMMNAAPCTDLFVRDGLIDYLRPSLSPLYFTAVGFGHGPMNVPGTSYIAPVGLSYAAFLMKTKSLGPKELVKFIRGSNDEPLLVAPFKQHNFLNQSQNYVNWQEEGK